MEKAFTEILLIELLNDPIEEQKAEIRDETAHHSLQVRIDVIVSACEISCKRLNLVANDRSIVLNVIFPQSFLFT